MADYKFIRESGTIVPDTADLLAEVEGEWKSAFGQDLQVTPDTPQGVMIAAETAARAEVAKNNAALANQINPNLAGGVYLDAICALLGLERATATRSLIRDVTITGQPLTPIPAGIRARTNGGDLFESVGAVVLDSLGNASVDFQSVEFGPVMAAPNSLVNVVDSVLGWETVNNPTAALPGVLEQSDESLRELRRRTLARQGISTVEAIISDVSALPNVRSLQFRENIAATTQVIDGITMVAHSVWVCVDGGEDDEIARSLLENKTNGAAWNGSITVPVLEPFSGQTYDVQFERPTALPILVRATVRQGSSLADAQLAVRDAIMSYVNGLIPNERGFVVGVDVSPFEIAGAISFYLPGMYVSKVEVALAPGGVYQTTELAVALDEIATTQESSITVIEL